MNMLATGVDCRSQLRAARGRWGHSAEQSSKVRMLGSTMWPSRISHARTRIIPW